MPPSARPAETLTVVVLALLLSLQPVTTDVYLPALPGLAADLQAPMPAAQMTLSAVLFSFGLGQLLLGPASDRFGRRPVLRFGLALYLGASIAAAWTSDIHALIGWRALQGIAVAASVVCARSMLRDLYEPHEGAQVMARAMSGLGVVALASPLVGGVLAATFGWRASFVAAAVYAGATLALLLAAMPETLARPRPDALRLRTLATTWATIVAHRTFSAWSLLVAATYAGLFTFLAGSSFVFIGVLGTTRTGYGVWLASCSASYLAGTFWCRRWVRRHGLAGAVARGAGFTLAGGAAMAAAGAADLAHPLPYALAQWLYAFGHGVHQPCGQAGVTGPFPQHAGAASALAGFMLAASAVAVGLWLGIALDGTVRPFAYTIGALSALTAAIAWTLVRRHGERAPAARPA